MITVDYYQKQAEIFANIDLNSSWFSYSIETVEFQGKNYQIYCPLEQSKPHLIVRWIQSIFRSLFGCCCEHPHLKTASALLNVTRQATQLLGQDTSNADLILKTLQTASSILDKLKNSLSNESWIECHYRIDATLSLYKNHLPYQRLCSSKELNKTTCFNIIYCIDWNKPNPFDARLLNSDYVNTLLPTIQNHISNEKSERHPHLLNNNINPKDRNTFIHFLNNLMENQIIYDIYEKPLSPENTERLRKHILRIMNILKDIQDPSLLEKLYAAVVFKICRGLKDKATRINANIENIFMKLFFFKIKATLNRKIQLSLQQLRTQLFRFAIWKSIQRSQKPNDYLKHEQATVSYYTKIFSTEFGLPTPTSSISEDHVLKGEEESIRVYVQQRYTPSLILEEIWEEIHDPYGESDLPNLFENWVQEFYKGQDLSNLKDEDGKYKHNVVLEFLENLQIIQNKEPA